MRGTTMRVVTLAAAGTLVLAGCSADTGNHPDGAASAPSGASADRAVQDEPAPAEGASTKKITEQDAGGTHLARTAALTTTVDDVSQASAKVRSIAEASGGYVSSEETHISPGDDGASDDRSSAEIVVTVPVDELDTIVSELAGIGKVTERSGDVQDLSQQYTDTTSRVGTLKKSVARLQELIDSADGLEEIVALESELTEREADLESTLAQQKALEKRTSTAPITVDLQSPGAAAEDPSGFLAGLASGWGAFTTALGAGMTALGAVTPLAVLGLVIAGPVLWLRRRGGRRVRTDVT